MKKSTLLTLFVFVLILVSCDKTRFFEKNIDIAAQAWSYDNELSFEINNTDTLEKKLFVNIRHSSLFSYRNILLKVLVQNPQGERQTVHINMPLSEPNGKWYGDCSGDVCMLRHPITYEITDTGTYTFEIVQDMRVNPLNKILSVGLRAENIIEE